jgi:alkane 1-monooxygenase
MRWLEANLVYFITPLSIVAVIISILHGGNWVWFGLLLFAANIVFDTLLAFHTKGAPQNKAGKSLGSAWLLTTLLYSAFPLFVILQVVLAWRVWQYVQGVPVEILTWQGLNALLPAQVAAVQSLEYVNGITGWQLVGATLATGIFQGLGIIFGHELSHTKGVGFLLSRLIMGLSGAAHFSYAHVYNHHTDLGDEIDAATAPRGRSLYTHVILSHIGQSAFSKQLEIKRLTKQGYGFWSWRNRWLRGYLISVPSIVLFALAGGWLGLAVLLSVWVIANFELEVLNYVEHYGLIRAKGQAIEPRHSWENDTAFTSWAFIEIGKQPDHHVHGETHFWELRSLSHEPNKQAPNYGFGYYTALVLALIPPLWHAVLKRKLAAWDRDFASPEEQKLAHAANLKAGYLSPEDYRINPVSA